MKKLFILLILFIFIPNIGADIISLNSGGSDTIVINPDAYIEGFFTGDVIAEAPVCGNNIIETGEECDDGNTESGDGCSSTCQTEEEEPPGGGGEVTQYLSVSPTEINLNLAVNTNKEQIIKVTNLGASTTTVSVSQKYFDKMVILGETSFNLAPGESKNLSVIFVALNQTGIFNGYIFVGNKVIPVSLNVKTKLLLFDSNIVVLNKDYKVGQGDKLKTKVTLIPMGDKERLDVTLNYVIKDYNNKVYLTWSETVLVEEQIDFKRNFGTGMLPLGKYVVGLELVYPGGVAPSSAHFEVVKITSTIFGKIVFFLINLILIVIIMIIVILIVRQSKKRKEQITLQVK